MSDDARAGVGQSGVADEPAFREMTISEWETVRPTHTRYSHYWANSREFEPQKFAENLSADGEWFDVGFAIAFLVNLFVAVAAAVAVLATVYTPTSERTDISLAYPAVWLGIRVGVALTIGHFALAALAPRIYVEWGVLSSVFWSIAMVAFPIMSGFTGGLMFPALACVFSVVWYCWVRDRIPFSAAMLANGVSTLWSHPSILLVEAAAMVFQVLMAWAYITVAARVVLLDLTPFIFAYFLFSYYWIVYTANYVVYMTGAGVSAREYFLRGTTYASANPVLDSLKHATTRALGSAAKAGWILALIEATNAAIRILRERRAQRALDDDGDGAAGDCLLSTVECAALCVLELLSSLARFMSRYGLIYCSMYAVPYTEGCRRWSELRFTKFVDVIIDGDIVGTSLAYNMSVFTIGAAVLGYWAGSSWFPGFVGASLITSLVAAATVFVAFSLFSQPFMVTVDTYLLAFAESPERLRLTNPELFETCVSTYNAGLRSRLGRMRTTPYAP